MAEPTTPSVTEPNQETTPPNESDIVKAAREEFARQIDELKVAHKAELSAKDEIIKDLLKSDTRRRADAESLDTIAERLNARNNFYKI